LPVVRVPSGADEERSLPKLRAHLGTTMAYTKTTKTLSRIRTIPDEAASWGGLLAFTARAWRGQL